MPSLTPPARVKPTDAEICAAWQKAEEQGVGEELRPNFERAGQHLATLNGMTRDFRDPAVWTALSVIGRGIVDIIAFILIDGDLVKHDYAEGAVEAELSTIYARLGAPVVQPDPTRLKGKHNYVARVIVSIVTIGIYLFWWYANLFRDGNTHFRHNWVWEDSLAQAVQGL